ncbi:septum formation protein Maf [Lentibacter algarum]|uniref:Maf family protein n=1 Tax=Lentibacter algarum TaxID=576131 RepID=UPI001C0758B9|nr:Maf family nucleotide pyrophosphatase [Lentibacter algarum]MBU2980331.1 septum formation protein Maf [Lentibacter algarum]
MSRKFVLASGSETRAQLLANAGFEFECVRPRVDEEQLKAALDSAGANPRDIADTLAEAKARKVSLKQPAALVLGCDQVLSFNGKVFSKPATIDEAHEQLTALSGQKHMLLSAVVLYHEQQPVWRHVGQVRLQMRELSEGYQERYLERNWKSIKTSVGGYKLEEEGVRLFTHIEGDYFTILGLPLIELINYLTLTGELEA